MSAPTKQHPLLALLHHLEAALVCSSFARHVTIIDTLSAPGNGLDTIQQENKRLKIRNEDLQTKIDLYEDKIEALIKSVQEKMAEMNAYTNDLVTRAQNEVDSLPEQKDARAHVDKLADEYVSLVFQTQTEYTKYERYLQNILETFLAFPEKITGEDIKLMKNRNDFVASEIEIMSPQLAAEKITPIILRVSAVYSSLETKRESSRATIAEADRLGKVFDEKYNELKLFMQSIFAGPKPEVPDAILERFSNLKDDLLKQGVETEAAYIKVTLDINIQTRTVQLYLNKCFDVSKQHLTTLMNEYLEKLKDFLADPVKEKDSVGEKDSVKEKDYMEEQSSLITEFLEKKKELKLFVLSFDNDKTTQSKDDTTKQFNRMFNHIIEMRDQIKKLNKIISSSEKYKGKNNSKFFDFDRSQNNLDSELQVLRTELRERLEPDWSISATQLKNEERKKNKTDKMLDDAISELKTYAQYIVDGIDNEWRHGPQPERKEVADKFKKLILNINFVNNRSSTENYKYIKSLCHLLTSKTHENLTDTATKIKKMTERIENNSNLIRVSFHLKTSLQFIISEAVALKIEHFMLDHFTKSVAKVHEDFEQQNTEQHDLHLEKETHDMMQTYTHKLEAWKKQYLEFVNKHCTPFIIELHEFQHLSDELKDELTKMIPILIRKIQASQNIPREQKDEMVRKIQIEQAFLLKNILDLIQNVNHEYAEDQKDQELFNKELILNTKEPEPDIQTIYITHDFGTYITTFARNLCNLAFPAIPAESWHTTTIDKKNTKTPQKKTESIHIQPSPYLRVLCTRVAHISSVAENHQHIAALRFALEITPSAPLVMRALAPALLATLEHPNIKDIRACFRESVLGRLHAFARPSRPSRRHLQPNKEEDTQNIIRI